MYLVTGGSGFCGFEIVKYLLARNEKVRVLDIEPLPEPLSGVEWIQADIRDKEAVTRACRDITRVIHTVAKVPISKAGREFFDVNVGGTRNILEAALRNSGIEKIVHISSSAVQLSEINPVPENAPYHPVGIYAKSKMAAELVCEEYRKKGLKVDMIRPRTVIGAGRLGIFDILYEWISEGRNIYIIGSGKNKIQFLHCEDLAACCYLASRHPETGTYNVGSSSFASLREDLTALIDHAGTKSKIVSLPIFLTVGALSVLDKLRLSPLASWHYLTYHKDFYFDNQEPLRKLGWKPQYGNREILKESYDDYLRNRETRSRHFGSSHRKSLKQGLLGLLKKVS